MRTDKYSNKFKHYYTGEIPPLIKNILNKYCMSIKSIADLGSGDGAILYALLKKKYLGNIEKVIAVDLSLERINNVRKLNDKILCIVADVCRLEILHDLSIDFVISNQVIEHLEGEEKFIKEVHRVLSKDGLFYLSTVFKKWYGWYFYRCNDKWTLDPTHVREYTDTNQLMDIIKKYKFEILNDSKILQWFPITDFIWKRIGMKINTYDNKFLKIFRKIKIPILGYYNWELVLKKNLR